MAVYKLEETKHAPSSTHGPLRWIINNLFATPYHVAFSFLILSVLYIIIPPFIHWAIIDATFVGNTKAPSTGISKLSPELFCKVTEEAPRLVTLPPIEKS